MPLTAKGEQIMAAMKRQYGAEEGERVFYASKNAGTISGVDSDEPGVRHDDAGLIRGAGVMFLTPEKRVLFLKRGPGGDYPGCWCFPGGKQEDGESVQECAVREAEEEIGKMPGGGLTLWTRALTAIDPGSPAVPLPGAAQPGQVVDFTTFLMDVKEEFTPTVNGEHVGYAWAPSTEPPQPLHPGCAVALERMTMDELGIARAMSEGRLTSPQQYKNVTLFALRITGTGVAYRSKLEEFVFRAPELYLNPEFLARCNGLPVIWTHPKRGTLDSKEFNDRMIGTIMLPYIKGDEVWGIAKIYDAPAIAMMSNEQMSTSPGVVLGGTDDTRMILESGRKLLIEGKPALLDHLAICAQGVWDKAGAPEGVQLDSIESASVLVPSGNDAVKPTDRQKELAMAENGTGDGAPNADVNKKLDAVLNGINGLQTEVSGLRVRIDSVESRVRADDDDDAKRRKADDDAKKRADDDARRRLDDDEKCMDRYSKRKDDDDDDAYRKRHDAEEASEREEREKVGEPKEVAADKAKKHRKDAEEREMKAMDDDAKRRKADDDAKAKKDDDDAKKRADADRDAKLRAEIKALESRLPVARTDDERRVLADAQARADSVFQQFGDRAPPALEGETVLDYRRRLLQKMQPHSPAWKAVDLSKVMADATAFGVAETQIFADAVEAAKMPSDLKDDELRAIVINDSQTGMRKIEFRGKRSFVHGLKPPTVSRLVDFKLANRSDR